MWIPREVDCTTVLYLVTSDPCARGGAKRTRNPRRRRAQTSIGRSRRWGRRRSRSFGVDPKNPSPGSQGSDEPPKRRGGPKQTLCVGSGPDS